MSSQAEREASDAAFLAEVRRRMQVNGCAADEATAELVHEWFDRHFPDWPEDRKIRSEDFEAAIERVRAEDSA
jgi:hypothetical protein